MNGAKVWALIKERRELLKGTPEGDKFMYKVGGGSCYYVVFHEGKSSLRGPVRREIAKAWVRKINRTSLTTGQTAKYLGTRSAAKTLGLL
jgi:hypothetical protein